MLRIGVMLGAALIAVPVLAQTAPMATNPTPSPANTPAAGRSPSTAGAPTNATLTAGAQVIDTAGGSVGTIEAVTNGIAMLSTGTSKVGVPVGSFAQGPNGLVFGMTKAEVDAKAGAAAAEAAATPIAFTVGTKVSDASGATVGTVKAISGDLVTVASPTASAQLSKSAFAKGPSGLMIGMSPAQFETAAKAAGGTKPSGTRN